MAKQKDTVLKLTPSERANIFNMLRYTNGTPAEVRNVFKVQEKIDFDESENKSFGVIRKDGLIANFNPTGQNNVHVHEKSIQFTPAEFDLIQSQGATFKGWPATKETAKLFDKLEI